MSSSLKSFVVATISLAAFIGPAFAQAPAGPDLSGISFGCIGGQATVVQCGSAAGAYAAAARQLPVAQADQAIVNAAVLIAEAFLDEECVEENLIPIAGLMALSDQIADQVLAVQVVELIDVVAACAEIAVAAIGVPTLASPN